MNSCRLLVVAAGAWLLPGCATDPSGHPPVGEWGGEHIALSVTDVGGQLDYDCAAGTIDQPLVPSAGGMFAADGTHDIGHGGPIHQDEPPNRHPAHYRGRIVGNSMTITITLTDSGALVGTFALERGATPRIVRCL